LIKVAKTTRDLDGSKLGGIEWFEFDEAWRRKFGEPYFNEADITGCGNSGSEDGFVAGGMMEPASPCLQPPAFNARRRHAAAHPSSFGIRIRL
jgi:hypothetical protein